MTVQAHTVEYPRVQYVLDRLASWIRDGVFDGADATDLGNLDTAEMRRVAGDLGLTVSELRTVAAQGKDAASLLPKMLAALNMDSDAVLRIEPMVMRDLQRVCSCCNRKSECAEHILAEDAAVTYRAFCPNAATLSSLKAS